MTEKTVYRMSSCGYCSRRLGYQRLDYEALPFPDWLKTSAEEGHWHETRIKDELMADDIAVYDEQEELKLEYPSFVLTGHIDGKISNQGSKQLLEIKSMSPFEFDRWMRGRWVEFPAYADQLTAYMEATGLKEALYIVKNRSTGYKDKQIIEGQPTSFNTIIIRLAMIEKAAQKNILLDVEFDPNNWECKRCEYRQHCMPPLPVLVEDQEKALFEAVEKWRKGDALVDEGSILKDAAKVILRGYAELTPTQKLIFNQLAVTIYAVHTIKYPKNEVEKLLSPDTLAEIAKITDRQDCRIDDLEKKDNG